MERTYRWIEKEFLAKYNAKTAHLSSISTFTKGSHPIPGDGYNPESKNMTTWTQGIPAGYGTAGKAGGKASKAKPAAKNAQATKPAKAIKKVAKKAGKKLAKRQASRR
jgi:hypothetical protein